MMSQLTETWLELRSDISRSVSVLGETRVRCAVFKLMLAVRTCQGIFQYSFEMWRLEVGVMGSLTHGSLFISSSRADDLSSTQLSQHVPFSIVVPFGGEKLRGRLTSAAVG